MATVVRNEPETRRYVIHVDGVPAGFAAYRERPGAVVFTHTEIDDHFAGRGLGGTLAKAALDDVRARGLHAVPLCPFIARYIRTHDEYADLVAPGDTGSTAGAGR